VGDLTGDGIASLVFWNQQGGATLYRLPVPSDPRVSPWPGLEVIASDRREGAQPEEGLAIADIDGDGRNELVAGTWWYKRADDGHWEGHRFALGGYITTRIAVGDLDSDGRLEIVVAEGDPCIYGRPEGGRLAWFKPGADIRAPWREHLLADGLLDAHTLRLADLCDNGRLDIFTGEVGVASRLVERPPRLLLYENLGSGQFREHLVDVGTGIHEGILVDILGRGELDIVGRPLHGPEKWQVSVWYRERLEGGSTAR